MFDPKQDKIKILHEAVSKKYDVGTLEEFAAKLQDPSKRKAFYDGVGQEYELGSFEEFENKVKKKDSALPIGVVGPEKQSISSPQELLNGLSTQQGFSEPLVTNIPDPQPLGLPGQIDLSKPIQIPLMDNGLTEEQDKQKTLDNLNKDQFVLPKSIQEDQYKQFMEDDAKGNYGLKNPFIKDLKIPQVMRAQDAEKNARRVVGEFQEEITGKRENQGFVGEIVADASQIAPSFNKAFIGAVTSIPKAVGILAKKLDDLTGVDNGPVENYSTYQLGQWIDKKALEIGITAIDEKRAGFLNSAVPSAFGSMIGMIMTGGPAAAETGLVKQSIGRELVGTLTSPMAVSGALQASVPEYEAAKAAGKSDDEAFSVFLKNIPGGLTEVIPVANMFTRLNKVTGNGLIGTIKQAAAQGTAQGLEEASQEAVQQYLTNKIAQGSYDPERDLKSGMLEGAGAGFVVGFVMPGVMGAMQNMSTEDRYETKKILDEYLKSQANEIKVEPTGKGDSQPLPKDIQKESVQVQAEPKKEKALKIEEVDLNNPPKEFSELKAKEDKLTSIYDNTAEYKTKQVAKLEREIQSIRKDQRISTKDIFKLPIENPYEDIGEMSNVTSQEEIDINKIAPSQPFVSKYYVPSPGSRIPTVIKKGDKYVITDGHHRIAKDILDGNQKVKINVRYQEGEKPNEPTGEAVKEEVRQPVQPVKEEPAKPAVEEPVKPIESGGGAIETKPTLNQTNPESNETRNEVNPLSRGTEPKGGRIKQEDAENITRSVQEAIPKIKGAQRSTRQLKKEQDKELESYARKSGVFIEDIKKDLGEKIDGGTEQDVYLNKEGDKVIKVNGLSNHGSWSEFWDRLNLQKTLFPETSYDLIGFTKEGGRLSAVSEQPYIDGNPVPRSELIEDLSKRGFFQIHPEGSLGQNQFYNPDLGIRLTDVHGENVIKDTEGNIRYIDPMLDRENPFVDEESQKYFNEQKIKYSSEEIKNETLQKEGKKLANIIAQENGFKNSTHLINSVNKLEETNFKNVQEIPNETIKEVVNKRNEIENLDISKDAETTYKSGDVVEFITPSGSYAKGTVQTFENSKYKIKSTTGTVWKIEEKDINPYEGEQASTQKIYQPPIGSPKRKNKTERIAVSPIYGAEPKKLKQIVIDLSKTIKSKIYYVKNTTRRNALGVYRSTNAAIAIKFQGDLDTTAHEVGHSIDDLFDLLGKINPAIEKELNKLGKFGSKPRKGVSDKKAYKLSEGLAEYIRAWMVNPSEVSIQYPETSKLFEGTVPSETKEALRKFGDDIRKFVGLSGHHQIMSNVQFEPEKAKGFFTNLLRNPTKENFELTIFDRLSQQWLNTLLPFQKGVKFLLDQKGIDKLMPSKDPVMLARLLAGENSKIQDILENGFINPDNPIDSSDPNAPKLNRLIDRQTGEAMNFEWLISSLDNSTEKSIKDEQEKVISYMVAKRTVEMSSKLNRQDFLTGTGAGVFQDLTIANKRLDEHTQENPDAKKRIEESARRYKEYADAGLKIAVASGRLSEESYNQIKSTNLEYVALQRISESSPDEEVVSFTKSTGGALASVKEIIYKQKGSSKTIKNPYESLIGNTANVIRESDRNNVLLAFKELLVHARGMHEGDPKFLGSIGTQVGSTGDNTITIFDKGKKQYWKLNSDVYKSVKNITDNVKLSPYLTALPSLLRWGIINFPVFAIKNRIRDIQARFVMSPNAFTGHDININRNLKQQTLEAYNSLGGGQAGYYLMSEDFYYKELDKAVRELAKDKNNIITTPGKMLSNVSDWYGSLIASGEIATRLEQYRSSFKEAKSKDLDDYNAMLYASFKSRDLLDFAVAGEQMKWINQLLPFSNAAVQGLRKTINSVKDDPGGFTVRFIMYAVLPSILLRMLAHSLDRDDEYAELPDYRRDLFYNIPVGDNLWIVIPKSFEIGVMSSGAERVFSKIFYDDKNALKGYAGSVARSVTPIDEAALAGPARSAVEVLANYDFFRKQHIIPTSEENLDLRLRNTETASRLGQMIGTKLSVDARQVDFLIKSNTGYFGDFAQRISDIGRNDTRHPIDFTATGLFKNDPVYDSKSVQELMAEVKRLGIKSNDSSLQLFNMTLSDYFDQKDPKAKAEAGKNVRETAQFISDMWKKISLEDIKMMEYNIKKDVKK